MKQRFELIVLVLLATVVLTGIISGVVFAQTSNPPSVPTQAPASKQVQAPSTASATQNKAARSNARKAGTNPQTPAKPARAQATTNSTNVPSDAGSIAPAGWIPPAQGQAATTQKTPAMPTKKTSSAASKPATRQKEKTGNADSH